MKTIIYLILLTILLASCSKSLQYDCSVAEKDQTTGKVNILSTDTYEFESEEQMTNFVQTRNSTLQSGSVFVCSPK